MACDILRDVGRELAIAVLAALRKLFAPADRVKVVLSGGVFANADDPLLTDTLEAGVLAEYRAVEFILLKDPPVLGAVLCALELAGVEMTPGVRGALWNTHRAHL